ncbi:MAG: hypothetical protein JW776_11080 [Candidatus Lokiarchaeota archaeon]|nr:hypothetical protein [Candidatus Lokiarchaeota archaeon]
MVLPQHLKESLNDLGFTDNKTLVYLTLVIVGTFNEKEFRKESKSPYPCIYQILQPLIGKGFVLLDGENRTTFHTATPPLEALENVKEQYFEELNKKAQNLIDILNPIYLMK